VRSRYGCHLSIPLVPTLVRSGFLARTPGPDERVIRLIYRTAQGNDRLKGFLERPGMKAHIMLGDTDWL